MAEQLPAEAPAEGAGGGIVEALSSLEAGLSEAASAAAESPDVPEDAKAAFQASQAAFRQGLEILAGGGSKPAPGGTTTPEQGASGAVPVSHGRPG